MSQPYAMQKSRGKKQIDGSIEYIFKFMEQRIKVEIWIAGATNIRFTGIIRGFDEWMNFVLDQAVEINVKTNKQTPLGRILLKGDTICLLHILDPHSLK